MKLILRFIRKREALLLLLAAIFSLMQTILSLLIPRIMGKVTTMLTTHSGTVSAITKSGLRMLLYAFLSMIVSIIVGILAARISATVSKRMRSAIFHKVMAFSAEEIGAFSTASLITRCTNDVTMIEKLVFASIRIVFITPIMGAVSVYMMLGSNGLWSGTTAVVLVIMAAVLMVLLNRIKPHVENVQSRTDTLNQVSREHLSGIKVIHAFNAYEHQRARAQTAVDSLNESLLAANRIKVALLPFSTTMASFLSILIYIIGAYLIYNAAGEARIGLFSDMVTFSTYAALATAAFAYMIILYISGVQAVASLERVQAVLDAEITVTDPEDAEKPSAPEGTIEFRNVSFRYPGAAQEALKDISFRVEKGQTVAIIGATGSGKTSLLNLIPRMYDCTRGEVLVDGVNVKKQRLRDLRNRIGYVPQRSLLFSGTIAENIDFGEGSGFKRTLRDIKRAAEIGQAREFIEHKEGGYQGRVEQGGANFSGGQRQRLTISRAICREPEIYLFDDSFSALDFKTDRALRKQLRESAGDATMLIVAQRISTIRNADKILVIDEGRLVGEGTHEALLRACPVYREIALSQLNEKEQEAVLRTSAQGGRQS